jgi:quinol-cytochrome oxidoreductase complex cytochrome b subunit/mono/diheme cytochrome c family protein
VFASLRAWLDHRFGYRKLIDALLLEHIPGGAKWRYVWGSALAFVFTVQVVTGVLLMTAYSPGNSTAWASVYFIQYQMDFGWLVRGLHHFGSGLMVVLMGVHMLQVVIAGAHLPPRELNWWIGLALLGLVLAMSLTGYLLPWDQKGYWATQVATNIAGNLPVLGPFLQKVVVGGPEYGHHTLTRFYALHVGVLPPLIVVLLVAHVYLFRKHGVTYPGYKFEPAKPHHPTPDAKGGGWFWPDQAFLDMLAGLAMFAVLLTLVFFGHGHKVAAPAAAGGEAAAQQGLYERWAHAGRDGLGANLDAPADAGEPYPARPEWYYLFLFQVLKYFEGEQEIIGTVVIPMAVGLVLFLLPLLGYGRLRPFGHVVGVLVVTALLVGAAAMTFQALADDVADPLRAALLSKLGWWVAPAVGGFLVLLLGLLAVLPRGAFRGGVQFLGSLVLLAAVGGAGFLTWAVLADRVPGAVADWFKEKVPFDTRPRDSAVKFQQELAAAEVLADRAINLAGQGIPADGAVMLLRRDPLTQGPKLFQLHCGACHSHGDDFQPEKPTASDLAGFGTAEWSRGVLREPGSPRYFGHTKLKAMANWVERRRKEAEKNGTLKEMEADFDQIAAWLGTRPRQDVPAENDASDFAKGYRLFEKWECNSCHTYKGSGGGGTPAPDLTGYGDAEWLRTMVALPFSAARYGLKNAMPAFRDVEGVNAGLVRDDLAAHRGLFVKELGDEAEAKKDQLDAAMKVIPLSDVDRELILRWLLKDDRVVFGGDPVSGPRR